MTNQKKTISIIIKTYDNSLAPGRPEDFPTLKTLLVESLRALETQTVLPDEILVVDSSAGDGIAETLRDYVSATDVPIRRVPLAPRDPLHRRTEGNHVDGWRSPSGGRRGLVRRRAA